jgi:hypothetical protein
MTNIIKLSTIIDSESIIKISILSEPKIFNFSDSSTFSRIKILSENIDQVLPYHNASTVEVINSNGIKTKIYYHDQVQHTSDNERCFTISACTEVFRINATFGIGCFESSSYKIYPKININLFPITLPNELIMLDKLDTKGVIVTSNFQSQQLFPLKNSYKIQDDFDIVSDNQVQNYGETYSQDVAIF